MDQVVTNPRLEMLDGHRSFVEVVGNPCRHFTACQVAVRVRAVQNRLLGSVQHKIKEDAEADQQTKEAEAEDLPQCGTQVDDHARNDQWPGSRDGRWLQGRVRLLPQ